MDPQGGGDVEPAIRHLAAVPAPIFRGLRVFHPKLALRNDGRGENNLGCAGTNVSAPSELGVRARAPAARGTRRRFGR
jgi:hypothetical protein